MDAISSTTIDSLAQQYRISQRKPVLSLENRKTNLSARLSALADIKAKLDALFSTVKDLSLTGRSSKFLSFTASSSSTNIATVSASSAASKGTHSLLVTQLAKADTIVSSQLVSAATGVVSAAGAGEKTIRLSVNGVDTEVTISLEAGDTNSAVLSKIATAVNESTAGVAVSVVADTSTTSKLVFRSSDTGSANAISLEDVSGSLLQSIGLNSQDMSQRIAATGTTGGFLYSDVTTLDAKFNVDGIDIIRGSNSVSDVLTGVTIELKGFQGPGDQPVSITVGVDTSAVRATIDKFIKAYNEALGTITSKLAVDPDTKVRQIFAGDITFRNLRMNLRAIGSGVVSSVAPGNPRLLSDIGIKTNADGTLSISDTAALDAALDADIAKVADLFSSPNGVAVRLKSLTEVFVSTGGQLDTTSTSLNSQLKSLTNQIKRFDEQLDKKVEQFRDDFARAQSAIAIAAQQQQMISAILAGFF
jgi:flagellar hook-associated protein 2